MKKYTTPNVKFTAFDIEDIITASAADGVIVNGSALTGEDATMYNTYMNNSSVKSENVSIFTW